MFASQKPARALGVVSACRNTEASQPRIQTLRRGSPSSHGRSLVRPAASGQVVRTAMAKKSATAASTPPFIQW
jgi:hypothetical protein